jgi:hypothetical protein
MGIVVYLGGVIFILSHLVRFHPDGREEKAFSSSRLDF